MLPPGHRREVTVDISQWIAGMALAAVLFAAGFCVGVDLSSAQQVTETATVLFPEVEDTYIQLNTTVMPEVRKAACLTVGVC